jgi:hypothetical protein
MASTAACSPRVADAAPAFSHGKREAPGRKETIESGDKKTGILSIMKSILNTA